MTVGLVGLLWDLWGGFTQFLPVRLQHWEDLTAAVKGTSTSMNVDERRGLFWGFFWFFYPTFLENRVWDLVFCVSHSHFASVLTTNERRAPAASYLLICLPSLIHIYVLGRRYFCAS